MEVNHVHRHGPGAYSVTTQANREWVINRVAELGGEWVAYSGDAVLDPFRTLGDALAAIQQIDNR